MNPATYISITFEYWNLALLEILAFDLPSVEGETGVLLLSAAVPAAVLATTCLFP